MSCIERIIQLARDKGISNAFICSKLGVNRTWLNAAKRDNLNISDDRLAVIADTLGTSVAYLKCEIDDSSPEKQKSPSNKDGLTNFQSTILQLLDCVPEDRQDELASLIESALKMSGLLK